MCTPAEGENGNPRRGLKTAKEASELPADVSSARHIALIAFLLGMKRDKAFIDACYLTL